MNPPDTPPGSDATESEEVASESEEDATESEEDEYLSASDQPSGEEDDGSEPENSESEEDATESESDQPSGEEDDGSEQEIPPEEEDDGVVNSSESDNTSDDSDYNPSDSDPEDDDLEPENPLVEEDGFESAEEEDDSESDSSSDPDYNPSDSDPENEPGVLQPVSVRCIRRAGKLRLLFPAEVLQMLVGTPRPVVERDYLFEGPLSIGDFVVVSKPYRFGDGVEIPTWNKRVQTHPITMPNNSTYRIVHHTYVNPGDPGVIPGVMYDAHFYWLQGEPKIKLVHIVDKLRANNILIPPVDKLGYLLENRLTQRRLRTLRRRARRETLRVDEIYQLIYFHVECGLTFSEHLDQMPRAGSFHLFRTANTNDYRDCGEIWFEQIPKLLRFRRYVVLYHNWYTSGNWTRNEYTLISDPSTVLVHFQCDPDLVVDLHDDDHHNPDPHEPNPGANSSSSDEAESQDIPTPDSPPPEEQHDQENSPRSSNQQSIHAPNNSPSQEAAEEIENLRRGQEGILSGGRTGHVGDESLDEDTDSEYAEEVQNPENPPIGRSQPNSRIVVDEDTEIISGQEFVHAPDNILSQEAAEEIENLRRGQEGILSGGRTGHVVIGGGRGGGRQEMSRGDETLDEDIGDQFMPPPVNSVHGDNTLSQASQEIENLGREQVIQRGGKTRHRSHRRPAGLGIGGMRGGGRGDGRRGRSRGDEALHEDMNYQQTNSQSQRGEEIPIPETLGSGQGTGKDGRAEQSRQAGDGIGGDEALAEDMNYEETNSQSQRGEEVPIPERQGTGKDGRAEQSRQAGDGIGGDEALDEDVNYHETNSQSQRGEEIPIQEKLGSGQGTGKDGRAEQSRQAGDGIVGGREGMRSRGDDTLDEERISIGTSTQKINNLAMVEYYPKYGIVGDDQIEVLIVFNSLMEVNDNFITCEGSVLRCKVVGSPPDIAATCPWRMFAARMPVSHTAKSIVIIGRALNSDDEILRVPFEYRHMS